MKSNVFFLPMNVRASQTFDLCLGSFLRFYSKSQKRNPYDVLGLKSTCSTKDIKKAYIKLCKELHPDMKPGDISQHKKFIELSDAYITLLNSGKRKNISRGAYRNPDIYWNTPNHRKSDSQRDNRWSSQKSWYEREEYQEFYRQHTEENLMKKHYRVSNLWVVGGCFILMFIGSFLYMTAYRYATGYTLEKADEKSRRLSESYNDLRKNVLSRERLERFNNLKKKWRE